ncbi:MULTISPECIES: helix-turn-helix domain-containing protein [Kocuria]|uniref:XRE family transcriptional regulator n=3 Tax=Kocuria TaxID=57493 RepID=A0A0B0DD91_9MICC|nr:MULTISPECIES: helix-turn-helix transcriptional regulator [Kocuria]KHE74740.1 XRE family transcriptional regulator [Kocuria marina]MCT2021938.1 helix-turn-helix transcriptional regulator [Kocuria marina]MDT0119053.1 helix-turn-helix transcriptional regulator [Kocuria sp. PD6]SMF17433.1 Cro/C1-type HTH DNA-binding domain-containing protein [Kocuria indica]
MKVIGYEWKLRQVMAAAGMFSTTKLIPELEARGIHLSASQVYRLAAEKPERLSLHVLAALMDIFGCTANDLITRVDLGAATARTGTGTDAGSPEASADALRASGARPKRARIVPPSDE